MVQPAPPPASQQAPHCFRHPDRETYISCQRCGRPICPDCMHNASVGYHCPVCVSEARRTARSPRTFAGGVLRANVGVVAKIIIGLNIAVFLLIYVTGGYHGVVDENLAMITRSAQDRANGRVLTGVAEGGYWRLLTSVFTHVQLLHLAFNMYALFIFGPLVEQLLGRLRFLALYLTCGIAGSVLVYLVADPFGLTVGASGAIFGLFGAAAVLLRRRGFDITQILVLIVINLGITFYFRGEISWEGHIGGLVSGVLLGCVFAYAPARLRRPLQIGAFALIWVVLIAATALRTIALNGSS